MARILKFVHAETNEVTKFGRDFLEEFPDVQSLAPDFEPLDEDEIESPGEDTPLDPDLIRQEIIAAAREDAKMMVQEAYQEGLARGTQAGRESFDRGLARCTDAINAASDAIRVSHEAFLGTLEPQVVALVKLMTKRVLEAELKTNPELIQTTARRALARMAGQYAVSLLVHPDDLAAIKEHQVTLLDSMPGVETLHVQASENVEPGGCIAQSENMEVDARLETLLGQVLDALTE